mmetsp:Transcript_28038/g.49444  ORF Transcript_28038/g.49444 Transcript_28038/m.49444 type:complete len:80 (-) Transcript_28038:317-556(-)
MNKKSAYTKSKCHTISLRAQSLNMTWEETMVVVGEEEPADRNPIVGGLEIILGITTMASEEGGGGGMNSRVPMVFKMTT